MACGGGSDDSSSPSVDLSGTWAVQETINGNCQGSTYPEYETYTATATQSGNNVSFYNPLEDYTYQGTISGNTVSLTGSRPSDGGTISINFSGTVSSDSNNVTGTATWTDGSYTCNGTTNVIATRILQGAIPNVAGTWNGNWQSSQYGLSGTFSATVQQQGATLSGTLTVPEISMNDASLTGTVTSNSMTFGDINGLITFTGAVNSSGSSASGTYTYSALNDSGTWAGAKN